MLLLPPFHCEFKILFVRHTSNSAVSMCCFVETGIFAGAKQKQERVKQFRSKRFSFAKMRTRTVQRQWARVFLRLNRLRVALGLTAKTRGG